MATSILALIQDFCRRNALPVPSAIIGLPDDQAVQFIGIANKAIQDMVNRFAWQVLTAESVFVSVAGEDQGTMTTLAPNWVRINNETIYDRTLRLPLFGPLSGKQWQALKALPNSGPYYKYRIRGDKLLFNPPGVAGHECAFEYQTNLAVLDADFGTTKPYYTKDTDTVVLDETCFQAAFEWNWKAAKGLDYAEDFRRYEEFVTDSAASDGTKRRVSLDCYSDSIQPGIFVPAGNWMHP